MAIVNPNEVSFTLETIDQCMKYNTDFGLAVNIIGNDQNELLLVCSSEE